VVVQCFFLAGFQGHLEHLQLRNIDSKRLVMKITHVEQDALEVIKKEASRVNCG
jgi:hypothetical protein